MTPAIYAGLRVRVCSLIAELGAMLGHLDTAAEIVRLPGPEVTAQIQALAAALDQAANAAEGTAQQAHELAEDTDRLALAARQAARGLTHEPDEAEEEP